MLTLIPLLWSRGGWRKPLQMQLKKKVHLHLAMYVLSFTDVLMTCFVSVKLLCGLEASQGCVEEVVSSAASVNADALDSIVDLDQEEDFENDSRLGRKKKNKRRKGMLLLLQECTRHFLNATLYTCIYFKRIHREREQRWEGVSSGCLVGAVFLHSSWRCMHICPNLTERLDRLLHSSFLDQALQKVRWFYHYKCFCEVEQYER